MPSTYKFTPLYGAENDGPMCSILQVDSIYILLDCGWDDRLDVTMLQPIKPYASLINAVLLSHPDFTHIGGLPYIYSKFGVDAPIYINADAKNIAIFSLEDAYENRLEGEETPAFNQSDINHISEKFESLVYNQRKSISNKDGTTVSINAREAGHTFGGCIWDIQTDTDNLVYSMNMNPFPDTHLRGASCKPPGNVSLLITDSCGISETEDEDRTSTDKSYTKFGFQIYQTLCTEGSVLIPVESTGRCIEILLVLDKIWDQYQLTHRKVYFLTKRNIKYITQIRGVASSLNEKLHQTNDREEHEAFYLKNVSCASSLSTVLEDSRPKVVVASMSGLETSLSQMILQEWCKRASNLLMFVTPPPPGTLAYEIFSSPEQTSFPYIKRWKKRLEGDELKKRMDEIRAREKLLREQRRLERLSKQVNTANAMEEEDDLDDMEDQVPYSRYQLFPYVEDEFDKNTDEFGVVLTKHKPLLPQLKEEIREEEMEEEEEEEEEDRTDTTELCNFFSTDAEMKLKIQRAYCDFSGIADYSSIHSKIREINPLNVICWHGWRNDIGFLSAKLSADEKYNVITAGDGETITIQGEHDVAKMKLDEKLLTESEGLTIGDYEIRRVCATVENVEEPEDDKEMNAHMLSVCENNGMKMVPVALRESQLGLRDIKEILNGRMDAKLESRRIEVSNRNIVIRKEDDLLVLEGNVSPEFKKLQEILYEQYKLI